MGHFTDAHLFQHIVIPPAIKAINMGDLWLWGCLQLMNVHLGDRSEEIERWAFYKCTSIQHIVTLPMID